MKFDPYRQWLQIPPGCRPPDHYTLLGIAEDEEDTQRIEQQATERYEHVRKYTLGPQRDVANRLLAEISQAMNCLGDVEKRRAYDRRRAAAQPVEQPCDDEEPVPEASPSPTHTTTFSWRVVGDVALAVLGAIDRLLRRIAGPQNTIVHNFLRVAAVLGVVAVLGVLLTRRPEASHGESVSVPVADEVSASLVVAEPEDVELAILERSFPEDYEFTFSVEELPQPDLEPLVREDDYLDPSFRQRIIPPGLPGPPRRQPVSRRVPPLDLLAEADTFPHLLTGRGAEFRRPLLAEGGGTAGSEVAVAAALEWLAAHQMPDGGWSFDHTLSDQCGGQCGDPGDRPEARNAATAIALLPLLGAGHTHFEGDYPNVVRRGLYFLGNRMKPDRGGGGSFWEGGGRMYSHGLAAIALCEAYAMTGDRDLHVPAHAALDFICYAQDPVGGGWRYNPREQGDMSVSSWQITALATGRMGRLRIRDDVLPGAAGFLDSVQLRNGAVYGYTGRGQGHATTAMGLLCRIFLGWPRDHPSLRAGVEQIAEWGPSQGDFYYNFHATQVLWHYGGEPWQQWNGIMRDQLIHSQARQGHERGSWFVEASRISSNSHGGRLFCTAMATMILEIYYRHLPIYRPREVVEEVFPE